MTTGLWVLVAAVVLATVAGLARRRYDGHFRGAPSRRAPASDDPGQHFGRHLGRDSAAQEPTGTMTAAAVRLTADDLGGADLGERATLVQFSSAFCQPCRATRRVLADVAGTVPGVAHIEIDAESRLDLVRRLDVMRTPTTLVLDADGRVTTRASGQPRKEQVLAALPI